MRLMKGKEGGGRETPACPLPCSLVLTLNRAWGALTCFTGVMCVYGVGSDGKVLCIFHGGAQHCWASVTDTQLRLLTTDTLPDMKRCHPPFTTHCDIDIMRRHLDYTDHL